MILAIFFATSAPPTGQAPGSHSPFAIAAAKPSQPGNPQPPQLFPGSSSLIAASVSLTSTAKNFPAIPKTIPIISPTPPTIRTAKSIPFIVALNAKIPMFYLLK